MSLYESEVTTLTGVDQNGLIAPISYATWRDATPYPVIPPAYGSTADAFKWGPATAGTGAAINYWLNTGYGWTDDQKAAFEGAIALWSAVANVNIVEVASQAQADFQIQSVTSNKPAYWSNAGFDHPAVGSDMLGTLPNDPVTNGIFVDLSYSYVGTDLGQQQGYGMQTLVHELGHMLGLGHGGPYDGDVNAMVQQFGPYDTRLWTIMSYIDPTEPALYAGEYPVTGTQWNGYYPLTPMMLDILAVQQLYGVATDGPLTGGNHTFGFNANIAGAIARYFDFTVNLHPIVTIWENGHGNTLDLSGYTTDSEINLHPGTFSSANGMTNNIGIAFNTVIETGIGGSGNDTIWASDVDFFLYGNAGSDRLMGGAGNDVLVGGADPDTIDGGGGLNVLRDTLADMAGDTVFHFGQSTTIDVWGSLIGRSHLAVIENADGNTTLDLAGTQILLEGSFASGGDFMAVARSNGSGPHTDVSFEPFLPRLFEGVAVEPDAINGVANLPFLTGDGIVKFSVTLMAAISAFNNTLGYYKVAADGSIFGVDILFSNTHGPGATTVSLGAPGSGEQIGFFLVQDGYDQFGTLPHNLSFVTQGTLAPANLNAGQPLFLQSATLGLLNGAAVFHSFATLNPGDANQVLSGVAPGGHDLQIGFEDIGLGSGDNDFQDVVINIHTDRDGVLFV